jgi:hypothetical protein
MRTDSTKIGLLAINRTIILVAYEASEMKLRACNSDRLFCAVA